MSGHDSATLPNDVGLLGRYELLLPIAAGGMATVWAARLKGTRGFQKIVAVKTMLPKLSEDAEFERMFLDEATHASQIHHPHVVEILDLGEQDGVLYIVMEWIDGVPLTSLMKEAQLRSGIPLPVAVRIGIQACAGLHAAHELREPSGAPLGLVHRDVSPQNLLVTYDGVTKVVDFGIAKATERGGDATTTGQVKGKVSYMAPEQIRSERVDRRVDVFAMGIVLYTMTTGKHPFRAESDTATMFKICQSAPPLPPRKLVPGYPPELERVVLKALAKDPEKRHATANELLRALDQAMPAGSARASRSDEEVADFVRELFAERRAQQRDALGKAQTRADERATSRVSLRKLVDSQPPPPGLASTQLLFDPSNQLTPSGKLAASVTVAGPSASVAEELTLGAVFERERRKRRARWIGGGAALLLAIVGVVASLALDTPDERISPAQPSAAITAARAARPPEPSAEQAGSWPPPAASPQPGPSASAAAPSAAPARAPGPKKPAKDRERNWQLDPGF